MDIIFRHQIFSILLLIHPLKKLFSHTCKAGFKTITSIYKCSTHCFYFFHNNSVDFLCHIHIININKINNNFSNFKICKSCSLSNPFPIIYNFIAVLQNYYPLALLYYFHDFLLYYLSSSTFSQYTLHPYTLPKSIIYCDVSDNPI